MKQDEFTTHGNSIESIWIQAYQLQVFIYVFFGENETLGLHKALKSYRLVLLASLWLENSQEFFISSWDVLFSTSHANLALKHTLGSNPLISALPGNFPLRSFSHSIFFSWFISLECFYWGNLKNLLECSLILKIFINMKNYHEFKKIKNFKTYFQIRKKIQIHKVFEIHVL